MNDFVHFRVHSDYSLGRGASKVEALFKRASELGMPALALTDHEALHGAMKAAKMGEKYGVQPIVGAKMFMPLSAKSSGKGSVLGIAQSPTGYANLCRMLQMELRPGRPKSGTLDGDALKAISASTDTGDNMTAGVAIVAGAGADGILGRMLAEMDPAMVRRFLLFLKKLFPDRAFVELCRNGHETEEQVRVERAVVAMARECKLPLLATTEVWYATPDRHDAFNILSAVMDGRKGGLKGTDEGMDDCGPRRFHMRSADEMANVFRDLPDAVDNTLNLARLSPYWPSVRKPILPRFQTGEGRSEADELGHQAREGLRARLERIRPTAESRKVYEDRLEFELGVIERMGFPGYFLIVSDFIKWAKTRDIPVGPGRGSGAGSLVAYAILVTDIDPIPFGLLFERFLNPERVSMPDFDIDFCETRRLEVVDYVQERYGAAYVGKIASFTELKPRSALKDVSRVVSHAVAGELSANDLSSIGRNIPPNRQGKEPTLEEVRAVPEIAELIHGSERIGFVFGKMQQVCGLYRNAGVHAAGIVIAGEELSRLVPMGFDPETGVSMTQFNMKDAEDAGLVKFDFLGLKTLTVIHLAIAYIREFEGVEVDLASLPYDDAKALAVFTEARTTGLFQFDSAGMKNALRDVRANRIEDLIAVNALYRPGPMEMIPVYAACKNGAEPEYPEPVDKTRPYLEETFGIMVYQEQILQVAQSVAGMSLGAADMLRRAIGKKDRAEMTRQKAIFVQGAVTNGVAEKVASKLFALIEKFADYGFNKSHAAAYSVLAYHTGWLKAHHPACFFAALMSFKDAKEMEPVKRDMDDFGVRMLLPDINASHARFRPERLPDGSLAVRFGLAAVSNVTGIVVDRIVAIRAAGPFKDLADFDRRTSGFLNAAQVNNLCAVGTFDAINRYPNPNRHQTAEILMFLSRNTRRDNGIVDLFAVAGEGDVTVRRDVLDTAEWKNLDQNILAAAGFHIEQHPLDRLKVELGVLGVRTRKHYEDMLKRQERLEADGSYLHGLVTDVRIENNRRGPFVKLKFAERDAEYFLNVYETRDRARTPRSTQDNFKLLETARTKGLPIVLRATAAPSAMGDRVYFNCYNPVTEHDFIDAAGLRSAWHLTYDSSVDPSWITSPAFDEARRRVDDMFAAGTPVKECKEVMLRALTPILKTQMDGIETLLAQICPAPPGQQSDHIAVKVELLAAGQTFDLVLRKVFGCSYRVNETFQDVLKGIGGMRSFRKVTATEDENLKGSWPTG